MSGNFTSTLQGPRSAIERGRKGAEVVTGWFGDRTPRGEREMLLGMREHNRIFHVRTEEGGSYDAHRIFANILGFDLPDFASIHTGDERVTDLYIPGVMRNTDRLARQIIGVESGHYINYFASVALNRSTSVVLV